MLGARTLLGEVFAAADDRPGKTGKAILGFGTWMRRYGGDRHVIGRSLTLNGQPYEIVGVLPSTFSLPREVMPTLGVVEDAEVVLPLPLAANAAEVRNREDYNIIATLKPGATVEQARAELAALTAQAAPRASRLLSTERRPDVSRAAAPGAGGRPRASRAPRAPGRRWRSSC